MKSKRRFEAERVGGRRRNLPLCVEDTQHQQDESEVK